MGSSTIRLPSSSLWLVQWSTRSVSVFQKTIPEDDLIRVQLAFTSTSATSQSWWRPRALPYFKFRVDQPITECRPKALRVSFHLVGCYDHRFCPKWTSGFHSICCTGSNPVGPAVLVTCIPSSCAHNHLKALHIGQVLTASIDVWPVSHIWIMRAWHVHVNSRQKFPTYEMFLIFFTWITYYYAAQLQLFNGRWLIHVAQNTAPFQRLFATMLWQFLCIP